MKRRRRLALALLFFAIGQERTLGVTISTEEFQEAVTEFRTEGRSVVVFFTLHAGAYRIAIDHDDFAAQLAAVAASYKLREPLTVLVRGLHIERVTGP